MNLGPPDYNTSHFVAALFPPSHFYLRKVKSRKLAICNASIVFFSSIFVLMLLTRIPIDVHLVIDIHLHMTFPLVTTILAYMGIFFVLRKRARVDFQRQTSMPSNPTLLDRRRLKTAQMERKITTTSFIILLFLIISIIPYFIAVLLQANCSGCRGETEVVVCAQRVISSISFS